jgi:cytochrome c peroxidase
VERGRALFEERGCGSCHSGDRFSDGGLHDVGTGERLRTPTLLGLVARAPYFHDGRVPTIRERFGSGHTRAHGDLGGLDRAAIADLTSYLGSLAAP